MAVTTKMEGSRQKAYVINEKQPFVTIFEVDEITGKLAQQYNVETLPADMFGNSGEYGAEIALHPNEKWLYVSHRGTGAIIVFEILKDGLLQRIQVGNTYLILVLSHPYWVKK